MPQLGIRYVLQLGLLPLPKTANPKHMRSNADVDFVISEADMDHLRNIEQIEDYGDRNVSSSDAVGEFAIRQRGQQKTRHVF